MYYILVPPNASVTVPFKQSGVSSPHYNHLYIVLFIWLNERLLNKESFYHTKNTNRLVNHKTAKWLFELCTIFDSWGVHMFDRINCLCVMIYSILFLFVLTSVVKIIALLILSSAFCDSYSRYYPITIAASRLFTTTMWNSTSRFFLPNRETVL